jgi:hypothetical protein
MSADSHAASGRGIGGTDIRANDLGLNLEIRWLGDCRGRGQRSLAYEHLSSRSSPASSRGPRCNR